MVRPSVKHRSALTRVLIAFGVGVVVAGIAIIWNLAWQVAAIVGWDVAASTFLIWVWAVVARKDSRATAELAMAEDDSRVAADLILITATFASLLGVALVFVEASGERGAARTVIAAVAVLTLLLSWSAIQTIFTLRYARLYYSVGGGIDFNEDREPDYRDFAYVAFTVGMTYQVSDTTLTSRAMRMAELPHAVLSFVFGTGVIATTVNFVADLLRP